MSSVSRLKIAKPILVPKFYPIIFNKYITIQGDAKFDSRKYDWYPEVISLLRPYLNKEEIKIVQIGGANDLKLPVDLNLCGQTSYRHSFDILSKALLHVGVDSLNIHAASVFGTKIVGLYSNMLTDHSKPYWSAKDDVRLLQAPLLNGRKPSYSANDSPKIINFIKPEEIAKAALELLGIAHSIDRNSLFFGDKYSTAFIESVPDCLVDPKFYPDSPLHIRYDYVAENDATQGFLYNQIGLRKSVIVTDKILNANALSQLRPNIIQVVVQIKNESQLPIVKQVEKAGIPYVLASELSEEEIQNLKSVYMDHTAIQKPISFTKSKIDSVKLTSSTKVKSSKLLLSQGKNYLSKAHWKSQKESNPFEIVEIGEYFNSEDFWNEAEFYYLFNE
jgi:hypothetical protein